MNKEKICVSICAETADELIKKIKIAESFADVIELRFDCLSKSELEKALKKTCNLPEEEKLLVTFRPKEQGGKRDISRAEREHFWCSGYDFCTNWADVEPDMVETASQWLYEKIICSHHDFNSVPENLEEIYENLKSTTADVLKIAVQTNDAIDGLAIWKLLERARLDNTPIVPIAMGEAGKWTRILGLAHGAFMTYAALDTGDETAPGQISVKDLIETYRVKELDAQTEIYGIIGNPVSHSLSPFIHNAAFKIHNLNAVFIPFEVKNLDEFISKFIKKETREIELNFKGFSVTIPHKIEIIKYLDSIDDTAKAIGAVNTVKIIDGKLHGFNTDAQGFIEPLKNIYGDLERAKVAILGNGGAARACVYALKKENADVTIFARSLQKAKSLANEFEVKSEAFGTRHSSFGTFDIVVNATPLGTKGKFENETIAVAEQIKNAKLVYDLVYNPFETKFLREAKSAAVPTVGGLAMLSAQAAKQFKIWTGKDAPIKEMSQAALKKLQR